MNEMDARKEIRVRAKLRGLTVWPNNPDGEWFAVAAQEVFTLRYVRITGTYSISRKGAAAHERFNSAVEALNRLKELELL